MGRERERQDSEETEMWEKKNRRGEEERECAREYSEKNEIAREREIAEE